MLDYMKISWQFIVCFSVPPTWHAHTWVHRKCCHLRCHHTGLCLPLSEHVRKIGKVGCCLPQQHNLGIKCLSGSSIPQTLMEMRRWVIVPCPSRTCAVFRASHGRSTMQERSQTPLPRRYLYELSQYPYIPLKI